MLTFEFNDFIECDLQSIAHWFSQRNPKLGELFLDNALADVRFLAEPAGGADSSCVHSS